MQYEVIKKLDELIANSQLRLNFEPKDWRINFKRDIVNALKDLSPTKQYFRAEFQMNQTEYFDVENVLFYNIGTSKFKNFDTKGVWYTLNRNHKMEDFNYSHHYYFVDSIENDNKNIVAEWNNIQIDRPSTSKKPIDYWLAFKKSKNISIKKIQHKNDFGIYIEIYKPKNDAINVINIQKPLLDGVISAFHKMNSVDIFVLNYVVEQTGISKENISNMISSSPTCLPLRDVIRKYREGVMWNPQDEKCIDVRIIIRDSPDTTYKLSGYIFEKEDFCKQVCDG